MPRKTKLPTTADCVSCHKRICERDVLAVNMKLMGEDVGQYYCLDCLASTLGCSVQDILDKVEEFKAQGCKLFS